MTELEYYKKKCELLENIEKSNPCDHDINDEQIKAYAEYREFVLSTTSLLLRSRLSKNDIEWFKKVITKNIK